MQYLFAYFTGDPVMTWIHSTICMNLYNHYIAENIALQLLFLVVISTDICILWNKGSGHVNTNSAYAMGLETNNN